MRLKVGSKALECTASNGFQGEARRDIPDNFPPPHQGRRGREHSSVSEKNGSCGSLMCFSPLPATPSPPFPFPFRLPGDVKGLGNVQTPGRRNAVLIEQQADVRASQPCLRKVCGAEGTERTTRNSQRK